MNFRRALKITFGIIVVMVVIASLLPEPKARGIAYVDACKSNLREIQKAKEHWAADHKKALTDVPSETYLVRKNGYIRDLPTCPSNGMYRINTVGELPTCSLAFQGHSIFAPESATNSVRGIASPP
jgi:hypothetical protein